MPAAPRGHDLWVFGYGSLMWRPDFPYEERVPAAIAGFHRAFCIASTVHRGSRERPGLVLGLDRGRACDGIAYRIGAGDATRVLGYLRARELVYGVYRETLVTAKLAPGASVASARVLAYTIERFHPAYTGPLSLATQAAIIRGARGHSGANLDYLINTVHHLRDLGIRERAIERLLVVAAGYAANGEKDVMHRPSVRGLCATCARRPAKLPRLPLGDQRRFGHRIAATQS
ncbi:MAG: gamma-glutamylcyclotransferase [Hyphomicrobiaceae bacterium]